MAWLNASTHNRSVIGRNHLLLKRSWRSASTIAVTVKRDVTSGTATAYTARHQRYIVILQSAYKPPSSQDVTLMHRSCTDVTIHIVTWSPVPLRTFATVTPQDAPLIRVGIRQVEVSLSNASSCHSLHFSQLFHHVRYGMLDCF